MSLTDASGRQRTCRSGKTFSGGMSSPSFMFTHTAYLHTQIYSMPGLALEGCVSRKLNLEGVGTADKQGVVLFFTVHFLILNDVSR